MRNLSDQRRACAYCGEPIVTDEADQDLHAECLVRTWIGSVGHQLGLCPCYGGQHDDPPGLTTREAAKAAEEVLERLQQIVSELQGPASQADAEAAIATLRGEAQARWGWVATPTLYRPPPDERGVTRKRCTPKSHQAL